MPQTTRRLDHLPFVCVSPEGAFTGHFFDVTRTFVGDKAQYHHDCRRCGETKDVPIFQTKAGRHWRSGHNSTLPASPPKER